LALRSAAPDAPCPAPNALIGESSGGNLAAAVALSLRGTAEQALVQVLLYPMLDARAATSSWRQQRNSLALPASQGRWLWRNYVTTEAQLRDERVSPSLARRLDGMPKTLVLSAEFDILRDEAEAFAGAIEADGGETVLLKAKGLPHGFLSAPALFADIRPGVLRALAQQWREFDQ
jgi:acetyl esterase